MLLAILCKFKILHAFDSERANTVETRRNWEDSPKLRRMK